MAGSVNTAVLIGNVGKDPEVRNTESGGRIAGFSMATSESWTTKSGERQEKTQWHKVSCFNDRICDVIERFVRKGSKVCVQGQIEYRKYVDQSGQEKYVTEIVIGRFRGELTLLGDGAARTEGASAPAASNAAAEGRPIPGTNKRVLDDMDDTIPF